MRQGEEQEPVQRAAGMYPAMACLRAERWKLLSWALPVQGWPKSLLISIKQRQLATRNFSSHRINIGMPRNNLLVGIEALQIIPWPVNHKFSANPQLDTIRKVSESVSIPSQYKNNFSWFLPPVGSSVPFHVFHQSCSGYTFTVVPEVINQESHWILADWPGKQLSSAPPPPAPLIGQTVYRGHVPTW